MANVFAQVGCLKILVAVIAVPVPLHMKLFQNNHTPAPTDTDADYLAATFSGYPGDVNPVWGTPFTNGSGKGETDAGTTTYTHNGGGTANTIYGAYFVDAAGTLIYADKFSAPQVMASLGDSFSYTPKFTAVTE